MKTFIKLIIFFVLCIQSMSSWSNACRVNNGQEFSLNSGAASTDVEVQLTPGLSQGVYSYGDLKVECRFEGDPLGSRFDYYHTDNQAFTFPASPSYQNVIGGIIVGNQAIPQPVQAGILIATMPEYNLPFIKLNFTPYIQPVGYPQSLRVAARSVLGELRLVQSNSVNSIKNSLNIKLIAANDVTLWPNTCTINGGSPLNIDFASVVDSKISSNPTALGPYTKAISFTYSCSDKTVTQAIGITLQAPSTASFNNNLIGTSNSALGVALVKGNSVVPVNSTYNAQMVNGDGTDSVTFNLVRNPSGALPATGGFTASAVLQIGLP